MPGIMPSVAARIVDNAFISIGYTERDMELVNFSDKLKVYCSQFQLDAVIDYIRSDQTGGLPAINHTIDFKYIGDVGLNSTYGLLVNRVCRYADVLFLTP